MFSYSVRYELD